MHARRWTSSHLILRVSLDCGRQQQRRRLRLRLRCCRCIGIGSLRAIDIDICIGVDASICIRTARFDFALHRLDHIGGVVQLVGRRQAQAAAAREQRLRQTAPADEQRHQHSEEKEESVKIKRTIAVALHRQHHRRMSLKQSRQSDGEKDEAQG